MSFVSNLLDSFRYTSKVTYLENEKSRVNHIICNLLVMRNSYADVLSDKNYKALDDACVNAMNAQYEINKILENGIQEVNKEYDYQ